MTLKLGFFLPREFAKKPLAMSVILLKFDDGTPVGYPIPLAEFKIKHVTPGGTELLDELKSETTDS